MYIFYSTQFIFYISWREKNEAPKNMQHTQAIRSLSRSCRFTIRGTVQSIDIELFWMLRSLRLLCFMTCLRNVVRSFISLAFCVYRLHNIRFVMLPGVYERVRSCIHQLTQHEHINGSSSRMGNNRKICKTWKLIIKICHASRLPPNKMKRNKTNRMDEPNRNSLAPGHAHAHSIDFMHAFGWLFHGTCTSAHTHSNTVCSSAFFRCWSRMVPGPTFAEVLSFRFRQLFWAQNEKFRPRAHQIGMHWLWSKCSPSLARLDSFFVQHTCFISQIHNICEAAINGTSNFGFSHWFLFHRHTRMFSLSLSLVFLLRKQWWFCMVYFLRWHNSSPFQHTFYSLS